MAEVKTLDLDTFRSLIREVAGEIISEMEMSEQPSDAVSFVVNCKDEECAKVVYVELKNKLGGGAVQRQGSKVLVQAPRQTVGGDPSSFVDAAVKSSGPVAAKYAPPGSYEVMMSEQDEIVALDVEEVPEEDLESPGMMGDEMGGMDDPDMRGEPDFDEDGGDAGMFDMDLSTPEGVANALEDLADMIARAADAVEDVVSVEGGDFDDAEAADYALGEARRLVRRARKSVIRENKRRAVRRKRRKR